MRGWETTWVVARLAAGTWLLWRVRRPHNEVPAARRPCSIIVPARDEATNLPNLLSSLAPQLDRDDELVVVDDHSTDATAAVASMHGARVVRAAELPNGWTGKTWACASGAAVAQHDVLVFLDADVTVLDGGLDRVLAAHRAGLLSVQPFHTTRRPYEQLSLFFNIVGMMGTDAFVPIGARLAPAGAFGPCLVTGRADYEVVGGHAAVAGAVLEDVALARRYRERGRRVECLGGRGTLSFRMYPGGLRALIEGWSKNMAGGASATRVGTLVLVVAWLSLCIQAPWLGPVVYGVVVVQLLWIARRIGRFVPAAILFPIPLLFFLVIFVRSAYLTLVRRRVKWKGRVLQARGLKTDSR